MTQPRPTSSVLQSLVRGWIRSACSLACGAALLSNAMVFAGDDAPTANDLAESSKLRMEARKAAEKGDFSQAADLLKDAALAVGDRTTADRAEQAGDNLEAGGGAQVDFGTLIQLIMDQTTPPALWRDNGDDPGGSMTPFLQGVFIGAPAAANALLMAGDNSQLLNAAELAQTANHNDNVRSASTLRLISLPRLEQHVLELTSKGQPIPEDVASLAGLTRVQYLFVFPTTGDVVIGGPAGDWKVNADGRSVNVNDGRPTLQFDDLVTLSRTFASGGAGFLMCSIDPKPEQVAAVKEFAAKQQTLNGSSLKKYTEQLEKMLGLQNVIVQGVPEDSRVAKVIVAADYEMKRIGIGEREGVAGMKSYFDLAGREERNGSSMDALRWWMTVGYDSILVSPDRECFEFSGQSIRCQSENQLVGNDGSRASTGKADKANEKFAKLFTQHLPELAEKDIVFADLQNVFDLALATALMQSHHLDRAAGWQPTVLTTDGQYQAAAVDVPNELMTAANSRMYRGGEILIQVAGGVRAELRSVVLDAKNFQTSEELEASETSANPIGQSGRWWWDAAAR